MLPNDVLIRAGHWCYCLEYADEFERHGGSFGAGAQIEHCVEKAPADKLLPIMRGYEKRLADGWKRPVEEVFTLMGLTSEDDQADALYYALAACRGHGIGLEDNHRDAIIRFEDVTGETLDTSPFHTEFTDLNDLAIDNLETPYEAWGLYNGDELIDGKFWSEEAAEDFKADSSPHFDECEVRAVPE